MDPPYTLRRWCVCSALLLTAPITACSAGESAETSPVSRGDDRTAGGETNAQGGAVDSDRGPGAEGDGQEAMGSEDEGSPAGESPAGVSGGPPTGDPSDGIVVEGDPELLVGECDGDDCLPLDSARPAPEGCGDGTLTEDEACDDGNLLSSDGCAANCLSLEPGFSCAAPGLPCRAIARCGDGLVASSEQCDDGNQALGDGCTDRCRIEIGKKCAGQPSICIDATCGDGVREGAEACDDGNAAPFDGCSSSCTKEPICDGAACRSDCGDGLLIDEECDDGNQLDGDGCSSSCTIENGFECVRDTACEQIGGQCVLRVPAVFRDFADTHPDFGQQSCNELVLGAVAPVLGPERLPQLSGGESSDRACLTSDANLAAWYTDSDASQTLISELVLFDNGAGGYVNRYDAGGGRFQAIDPASEKNGGASEEACAETCVSHARNGEAPMFDEALRCEDVCRPIEQERSSLVSGELSSLQGDLNRASDAVPRDEALITQMEADIAAVELRIEELAEVALACEDDCRVELSDRVLLCSATCKPCGGNPDNWCIGGEAQSFDGTPLFFPVDSHSGETANSARAQIPAQYGYSNWPWEDEIFDGAPAHNFFFTSEVHHWFEYDANTNATLEFLGDDDVWVFINGRLAVDLGGIHAPASGSVTLDAATGTVSSSVSDGVTDGVSATGEATAEEFGLIEGNVYRISVFHAERRLNGSSFKLTLGGFEATPSDCSATCGDGILSFGEECDDGVNDGGYGECDAGCRLGPFCGDGTRQEEYEDCDGGPGGGAGCPGCRVLRARVR
jgi:fibro-slime domain-containing protein